MKKNIHLLCGGNSSEHEVSLKSCKNIVDAIDTEKYNLSIWIMNKQEKVFKLSEEEKEQLIMDKDFNLLSNLSSNLDVRYKKLNYFIEDISKGENTLIFPIIHGYFGEDGKLQGILESLGIPYVGSSSATSSTCMDKDIAKLVVSSLGIKVADSIVLNVNEDIPDYNGVVEYLGTPFFIKPARQGSSVGVSKIKNNKEYIEALKTGFEFDSKLLMERGIVGLELECAILGNNKVEASRVGSVIVEEDDFYSYENKYVDENGALLEIPANITNKLETQIQSQAIKIYKRLECNGFARVDFFVENDEIIFNEINTIPGFTNISMYPKLWEISGLSYSGLIDSLIELAIEKHSKINHEI